MELDIPEFPKAPLRLQEISRAATALAVIVRHHKENRAKCSIQPVRNDPRLTVLSWRSGIQFDATGMTLLAVDAPPLTAADAHRPLLLLDCNWHRIESMLRDRVGEPVCRSLPTNVQTAYPRQSKTPGNDPECGLATIEALVAALWLQGVDARDLLAHYHWREAFLAQPFFGEGSGQ
ncbi:MAG: hypothetical protein SFY80_03395 [Verrucomicrobiota bacterium]|nr:hypothetical protein [Verrucomicrobiota bacterium]